MMAEKISLKWNDFYFNVSKSFRELRHEEYLQDVTLVSDDNTQISAHKLVLSACSEHFKSIFKTNAKQTNPIIDDSSHPSLLPVGTHLDTWPPTKSVSLMVAENKRGRNNAEVYQYI